MGRSGGLPILDSQVFLAADFNNPAIGGGADRVVLDGCKGFSSVHAKMAAANQNLEFYNGPVADGDLIWQMNGGLSTIAMQDPDVLIRVSTHTLYIVAPDANPVSLSFSFQGGSILT
jgi:hypothetical protein